MKAIRAFIIVVIFLLAMSVAASPALAWYWPIMGFSSGWGMPSISPGGPTTVLPGTPEWAVQTTLGASLVPWGYPYGQIQGSLNFGLAPAFGSSCSGFGDGFGGIGKIG